MNRFDEVTGKLLQGDSPTKHFGEPLPGDPSIMYTIQKNQLGELERQFAKTVDIGDNNVQTGKFVPADVKFTSTDAYPPKESLEANMNNSNRSSQHKVAPPDIIHSRNVQVASAENVFQTQKFES